MLVKGDTGNSGDPRKRGQSLIKSGGGGGGGGVHKEYPELKENGASESMVYTGMVADNINWLSIERKILPRNPICNSVEATINDMGSLITFFNISHFAKFATPVARCNVKTYGNAWCKHTIITRCDIQFRRYCNGLVSERLLLLEDGSRLVVSPV